MDQEIRIANKYHLTSLSINQNNIYDSIASGLVINPIGNIDNLKDLIKDHGDSLISTTSVLSYMNPYTVTKSIALVHNVGTGKTRKALLSAMWYNKDITVIAVHSIQISPFLEEMKSGSVIDKLYPNFNKRIDIMTCKSIVTALKSRDHQRLDFYFKDRVIIIDETHHIRNTGDADTDKKPLFASILQVVNMYSESKRIFLTATPLVDIADETKGIYKLVKDEPFTEDVVSLAINMRGYISRLEGVNIQSRKKEVKCLMDPEGYQWYLYQMFQDDRSSVHSKTGAVSRFITCEDYNASEYPHHSHYLLTNGVYGNLNVPPELHLMELRKYSIKYYILINHLLKNIGYPKFIFESWKKRGGADRLVELLTLPSIGYTMISTEEEARDVTKQKKMIALHKLSKSTLVTKKLLDIFNSEENRDGSLIELLIATPKFSESMSIRTAKECHIMQPQWNETTEKQIEGRITRRSSLWYLPRSERSVTVYIYVLYKPDGTPTVESYLQAAAKEKYRHVSKIMALMDQIKIEQLYQPAGRSMFAPVYPHNTRVNSRIRSTSKTISHRDIPVDLMQFMANYKKFDNFYQYIDYLTMSSSMTLTVLDNRLNTNLITIKKINMAIQAIEQTYLKKAANEVLEVNEIRMLEEVQSAIMEYSDTVVHMLYFVNDDTVEYQRLVSNEKRVVRILDRSTFKWRDSDSKELVQYCTNRYNSMIQQYTDSILDQWRQYKYYVVRYTLPPCYRLVQYKETSTVSKTINSYETDHRKLSRGEKWQHCAKGLFIGIILGYKPPPKQKHKTFASVSPAQIQLDMLRKKSKLSLFQAAYNKLYNLGLVTAMPI